jgi:hypothetical protein
MRPHTRLTSFLLCVPFPVVGSEELNPFLAAGRADAAVVPARMPGSSAMDGTLSAPINA